MKQIELDLDKRRGREFAAFFRDFLSTNTILHDDFQITHQDFMALTDESRLPFQYRTLVRTFFAYLDHGVHNFRQAARQFPQRHYQFTDNEIVHLSPTAKLGARDSIKSAFKLMAKAFAVESPDFGDQRFEQLLKAVQQRHAFMHPKTPDDIAVTFERAKEFATGGEWYTGAFTSIVNAANENLVDAMKRYGIT